MDNTITLKLEGDIITSDKLRRGIGDFYSLLDVIASEISQKKKPVRWNVSVGDGSIVLVSEGKSTTDKEDYTESVLNAVKIGLNQLEQCADRPRYFTDSALEYVENLANLPEKNNGLSGIGIFIDSKRCEITKKAVANIDQILGTKSRAMGSIEGRLLTVSKRSNPRVFVVEFLTNKSVQCNITDYLIPEALSAFDKRVYVFGMISYTKEGHPKSIKAEELKIFPDQKELPTFDQMCGILKD